MAPILTLAALHAAPICRFRLLPLAALVHPARRTPGHVLNFSLNSVLSFYRTLYRSATRGPGGLGPAVRHLPTSPPGLVKKQLFVLVVAPIVTLAALRTAPICRSRLLPPAALVHPARRTPGLPSVEH